MINQNKTYNPNRVVSIFAAVVAVLGLIIDLANADGILRTWYEHYFPSFPDEISLSMLEINSAHSFLCLTNETQNGLIINGETIPIAQNTCHRTVKSLVDLANSSIPRDALHNSTYLIVHNGLSTDLKEFLLETNDAVDRIVSILPKHKRAICTSFKESDDGISYKAGLTKIGAVTSYDSKPLYLNINSIPKGNIKTPITNCGGVFMYPNH